MEGQEQKHHKPFEGRQLEPASVGIDGRYEERDQAEALPERADSWIDVGELVPNSPQQQDDGDSVVIHTHPVADAGPSVPRLSLARLTEAGDTAKVEADQPELETGAEPRDEEAFHRNLPPHGASLPSSSSVASLLASEFKHLSPLAHPADGQQQWPSRHAAGKNPAADAAADLMSSPRNLLNGEEESECREMDHNPEKTATSAAAVDTQEVAKPTSAFSELLELLAWENPLHSFCAAALLVVAFGLFLPLVFGSPDGVSHIPAQWCRLVMLAMGAGFIESKSSTRSSPAARHAFAKKAVAYAADGAVRAVSAVGRVAQDWEELRLRDRPAAAQGASSLLRMTQKLHWCAAGALAVTGVELVLLPILRIVTRSSVCRFAALTAAVLFLQAPSEALFRRFGPAIRRRFDVAASSSKQGALSAALSILQDAIFCNPDGNTVRRGVVRVAPILAVVLCALLTTN